MPTLTVIEPSGWTLNPSSTGSSPSSREPISSTGVNRAGATAPTATAEATGGASGAMASS
ncbi:MAG TPA: hypothetical protein VGO60_02595 [Iamia sp.]|nr:hypothetical protein [Iamia sp.]